MDWRQGGDGFGENGGSDKDHYPHILSTVDTFLISQESILMNKLIEGFAALQQNPTITDINNVAQSDLILTCIRDTTQLIKESFSRVSDITPHTYISKFVQEFNQSLIYIVFEAIQNYKPDIADTIIDNEGITDLANYLYQIVNLHENSISKEAYRALIAKFSAILRSKIE